MPHIARNWKRDDVENMVEQSPLFEVTIERSSCRPDRAELIYAAITSVDGYVADADGSFDWAEPDEEVIGFVNDLERSVGAYLFGRRMYEVMLYWESPEAIVDQPAAVRDFAEMWLAADKIVYSSTLTGTSSARTRIEREFDPNAVRPAQGRYLPRHHGRRSAPRRPGDAGRARRRVSPQYSADDRGWRDQGTPE